MDFARYASACAVLLCGMSASGQTVAPYYDAFFTIVNLGPVEGVAFTYGGVCFANGDPNTLLIGGDANTQAAQIYAAGVVRGGDGHITGFAGPAAPMTAANGPVDGGIDGGLSFLDGGVLAYGTFPDNSIGQLLPGSTVPDKLVDLAALGVMDSVGGFMVVPEGFPGASRLKLVSYYPGFWYDAELVPDGAGTFDVANVTPLGPIGAGPEGIAYVSGTAFGFGIDTLLVAKFDGGRVDSYSMDDDGNPLVGTEYAFVNGIFGAEGLTTDPATGDFLISTFDFLPYGGNEVFLVRPLFESPTCDADLTGDGIVDGADLGELLGGWGGAATDLTGDGTTDGADLGVLLGAWGPC